MIFLAIWVKIVMETDALTVAELIEILKQMPQNKEVHYTDMSGYAPLRSNMVKEQTHSIDIGY